jgi:hypothetical protein
VNSKQAKQAQHSTTGAGFTCFIHLPKSVHNAAAGPEKQPFYPQPGFINCGEWFNTIPHFSPLLQKA